MTATKHVAPRSGVHFVKDRGYSLLALLASLVMVVKCCSIDQLRQEANLGFYKGGVQEQ